MTRRVAIVSCASYHQTTAQAAVDRAVGLLGGMDRFVRQGQHVMVRPNLIAPHPVEAAATTHPAVVEAVVRAVQGAGGLVTIGDCPGGNSHAASLEQSYQISGMADVAERTGTELDYDPEPVELDLPGGSYFRGAALARGISEADVVITVPKLKTHSLTGLTGAVKLCFGSVPGRAKTGYHLRYPKVYSFSGALLDIHDLVNPRLTVMDAVVGMEGDGPTGGDPRHVGAILASDDSLACDVVAAWLVGLDPLEVSTAQVAVDQGRIDSGWEDIDVVGEPLSSLRVKDFRPASTRLTRTPLFNRLVDILGPWMSPHPVVGEGCTRCGTCATNCPAEAITIQPVGAHIDHSQCTRCFCCQELCPERAITIHYPRLTRRWATLV
jgi:uncharacterized protein (DUF362 family)/Pyruvate/2-oxoacid:ferredoxin oxidoreductase delta subunit